MGFFSQVGQNIKSGFQGIVDFLKPAPGTGVFRPEAAISEFLKGPSTGELFSKATAISAPSKVDTGLMASGLNVNNYQSGNIFTQPGGNIIGQINQQASGVNAVPQIRPLITSLPDTPSIYQSTYQQPQQPYQQPQQPVYQQPYRSQETMFPRDPRTGELLPAPSGAQAVQGGGGQQAQQGAAASGTGALAGTGAGMSLGGAVGGIGASSLGTPQEEQQKNRKQPQFQMVTLDQARAMGLQGAGQSGVFKDAQGNFYGISNVQIANQFSAPNPVTGRIDVTQRPLEGRPFESSLKTGPISAEVLMGGKDKLLLTSQDDQAALQAQINQFTDNAPPTPQSPVIETPEQQAFLGSSQDPYGLQAAMDQSRTRYGLPDLENQRINAMKNIQGLSEGIQKIIKDIRDNPDLPKGLAERRISEFSRTNGITLQNLQSQLQIINTQIDQANEAVNRDFGITKLGIETQQRQQEQERDNTRQQIQQYISSGAFAEFTDAQLQNIVDNKIGYDLGGLKTMRDALKSGSERKIADAQAKLEKQITQNDPFKRLQELVKQNPATGEIGGRNNVLNGAQWDKVSAQIDKEFGAGTATQFDSYFKSIYAKSGTATGSSSALNFESL